MGPHFKKTVTLDHGGRRLELRVAQDLFSSHEVDVGHAPAAAHPGRARARARRLVLDLGCGYGPLGLGLRAAAADRVVHLVDRDALAVEYSRENAAANRLDGRRGLRPASAMPTSGPSGFDLVVSNIPAKAGAPVIELLLGLRPGLLGPRRAHGRRGHRAPARAGVAAAPGGLVHGRGRCSRRATASYAVFHYRFRGPPAAAAVPTDPAGRLSGCTSGQQASSRHGGVAVRLRTPGACPSSTRLGSPTRLVADAVLGRPAGPPETALVLHPGQGWLPCLLWAAGPPGRLRLVDRDLLALRVSRANLLASGCPPERAGIDHRVEPGRAWLQDASWWWPCCGPRSRRRRPRPRSGGLVAEVPPGARVVLGASSTAITRSLAALDAAKLPLRTVDRRRAKGSSVVVLQRR
jgi:16S rRNA G1207 methylase RsmC